MRLIIQFKSLRIWFNNLIHICYWLSLKVYWIAVITYYDFIDQLYYQSINHQLVNHQLYYQSIINHQSSINQLVNSIQFNSIQFNSIHRDKVEIKLLIGQRVQVVQDKLQ